MNLRRDPFERADFNSNTYWDWMVDHVPQLYLMQAVVAAQIEDFVKFPPRQKPASFNLDAVLAQVTTPPPRVIKRTQEGVLRPDLEAQPHGEGEVTGDDQLIG